MAVLFSSPVISLDVDGLAEKAPGKFRGQEQGARRNGNGAIRNESVRSSCSRTCGTVKLPAIREAVPVREGHDSGWFYCKKGELIVYAYFGNTE